MKNIKTLILAMLVSVSAVSAQLLPEYQEGTPEYKQREEREFKKVPHLLILGTHMDGTVYEMTKYFKEKESLYFIDNKKGRDVLSSYTQRAKSANTFSFIGEQAKIEIIGSVKTKTVHTVYIILERKYTDIEALRKRYKEIVELYKSSDRYELSTEEAIPTGSKSVDECITSFSTEHGWVDVRIFYNKIERVYDIFLEYIDSKNNILNNKENMELMYEKVEREKKEQKKYKKQI